MLHSKWKVFKVFNYIQLIYSIGLALFIGYITLIKPRNPDLSFFTFFFIGIFSYMAACSFLNLHILDRNFPDKPLIGITRRLHFYFSIANIVLNIFYLIGMIFIIIDYFQDGIDSENMGPTIALMCFLLIWVNNLYISLMEFQVTPFIKKNFLSLIDEIGKENSKK